MSVPEPGFQSGMPSSHSIRFTLDAEADLRVILRHSRETWGERQRRKYAALLDAALVRLASCSGLGRQREELAAGLRGHPIGQHTIFYHVSDNVLIVERIIHRARDIETE